MANHTVDCQQKRAAQAAPQKAWAERYPGYCRKCKGEGVLTWEENQSPHASGYIWLETITELCTCVEDDTCPRCGGGLGLPESWEGEPFTCPGCGWASEQPDTLPYVAYSCDCVYREFAYLMEEV